MFPKYRYFLVALVLLGSASLLNAQISIIFEETETGVSCTYVGSLDLRNAASGASSGFSCSAGISSSGGVFRSQEAYSTHVTRYALVQRSASFGTGSEAVASSYSDDENSKFFTIWGNLGMLIVPLAYGDEFSLSGSLEWESATFSSLGLTSGSYVYTVGNSTAAETITITIPSVVPEPATYALGAGVCVLGLAVMRRRR